jgi:Transposase IS66 family
MKRSARHCEAIVVDLDAAASMLEHTRDQWSPDHHAIVEGMFYALVETTRQLHARGASLARLRRLWGIRTTEKLSAVFPGARTPANDEALPTTTAGRDDLGEDERDDGGDSRDRADDGCAPGDGHSVTPDPEVHGGREGAREGDAGALRTRKGHGRIAAAAYRHAGCTHVAHDRAHVGDTCPECSHGTLYRLREPERIVRITGQPPLVAHTWELDRLRCSGCGGVFTATAPTEAQGCKYDERAIAMMSLLRYGTGMPLHRLDRLQRNLETPVPASTQWEAVRDHVDAVAPVHDELCRQAASGRVLHNDDTSRSRTSWIGVGGTKLPCTRPCASRSASHIASFTSDFLPGTLRTCCAFARTSSNEPSSTCQTGLQ